MEKVFLAIAFFALFASFALENVIDESEEGGQQA